MLFLGVLLTGSGVLAGCWACRRRIWLLYHIVRLGIILPRLGAILASTDPAGYYSRPFKTYDSGDVTIAKDIVVA